MPDAKAKVTCETIQGVWISIRGEDRPFPMIRNDGGLLLEFHHFLEAENITEHPNSCKSWGGGSHSACYNVEDAVKIIAWLKERGVDVKEYSGCLPLKRRERKPE